MGSARFVTPSHHLPINTTKRCHLNCVQIGNCISTYETLLMLLLRCSMPVVLPAAAQRSTTPTMVIIPDVIALQFHVLTLYARAPGFRAGPLPASLKCLTYPELRSEGSGPGAGQLAVGGKITWDPSHTHKHTHTHTHTHTHRQMTASQAIFLLFVYSVHNGRWTKAVFTLSDVDFNFNFF